MKLRLGEGIAGKVAQSGKSKLGEDISREPNAAHPSLISKEGLKAFISVPLKAKGTVLGVMNVASHSPRNFTQRDMFLLQSIDNIVVRKVVQLMGQDGRHLILCLQTI